MSKHPCTANTVDLATFQELYITASFIKALYDAWTDNHDLEIRFNKDGTPKIYCVRKTRIDENR